MLKNKLATASLSLGQHPSHILDQKIITAATHGYQGIEIVYHDLERYAIRCGRSLLEAATRIRTLCSQRCLSILALAPFDQFEGDRSPIEKRLAKAQHWIEIARALGADYLQIPAHFGRDCDGDRNVIVSDLQALADLGAAKTPVISIAYEGLSWSTHVSTWETTLEVINAVDRPNFGLCLDSFHILTKLWGDCRAESGKYANADEALASSLRRFKEEFPVEKMFYIQLSDGERFDPPYTENHEWALPGEHALFTWSKHGRPYPGERQFGAYLPVDEFVEACISEKGFGGWVSMEIFDRRMEDQAYSIDVAAQRGLESWEKLKRITKQSQSKL